MIERSHFTIDQMAHELRGILYRDVESVSGQTFQPAIRGEESFLRDVVSPIYQVLRKVN